jgi:hypothetical protein
MNQKMLFEAAAEALQQYKRFTAAVAKGILTGDTGS